jgi:hypothetical protein
MVDPSHHVPVWIMIYRVCLVVEESIISLSELLKNLFLLPKVGGKQVDQFFGSGKYLTDK